MFEIIDIVGQAYKGYGYSYLKNKIIFVPFTIQEDKVKIKIIKEKKNYMVGEVVTVIKSSKNRKTPFCEHFGTCGGCHYQHIHYSEQINIKVQILKNTLKRIGNIEVENIDVRKSKQTFYRHRVKFQQKGKKIGFFKQNSNDFLEINFCPILEKPINDYIKNHKERIIEIDSFSKLTTKKGDTLKLDLSFIAKDTYIDYSMGSFTQVNFNANKELIKIVTSLVDDDSVLEAFCGIGNFTIPLGLLGHTVDAFEIDKTAINTLKKNAQRLSLKINATCYDLNKKLNYKKHIGTIILDPPRSGSPILMNFINEKKPKKIIYVSCEPPTLARDIAMLKNYSIEKVFLIDMFPNTYHFETVAVLSFNK